ncbi:hypothetical protein AA0243_0402 [Novacetimonas hansenii NRIC 0243]|nr:hypothetical protein AA0243_0402 [Novacetimonas hansenii NRIC 0243]
MGGGISHCAKTTQRGKADKIAQAQAMDLPRAIKQRMRVDRPVYGGNPATAGHTGCRAMPVMRNQQHLVRPDARQYAVEQYGKPRLSMPALLRRGSRDDDRPDNIWRRGPELSAHARAQHPRHTRVIHQPRPARRQHRHVPPQGRRMQQERIVRNPSHANSLMPCHLMPNAMIKPWPGNGCLPWRNFRMIA